MILKLDLPKKKSKIAVAMSGGIDSSTVAGLLHEQGHEIVGITLQLYDYGALAKKGACCAGQDIYDAKEASEHIGIPHYVFNYESKFKEKVIDNFIDTYLQGQTPIPCVMCNMSVKFTDLIKAAKELGMDFLATGHYVKKIDPHINPELYNLNKALLYDNNHTNHQTIIQKSELHKAFDSTKDQSYFLFNTTQEQLDYLLFPLGNMEKTETRLHAKRLGIRIHNKPDSQDICFVPNGNYIEVIEKYRPNALKEGNIMHIDGFILGKHLGIHHYTIGQRKGLGIAYEYPLYVIKLDAFSNTVYVGPEANLQKAIFYIKEVNLLETIDENKIYTVKIRSQHIGSIAKLTDIGEGRIKVELYESQRAISPGQACVIYDNTRVLGGGWIYI